jgi:hypothetical protein
MAMATLARNADMNEGALTVFPMSARNRLLNAGRGLHRR